MGVSGALHDRLAAALAAAVDGDGGVAFGDGQPAEPEPTAVAAIALDDSRARGWLLSAQHPNGGFALDTGAVETCAPTALIALALLPGDARERAIDYAVSRHALVPKGLEGAPAAWGWTPASYSWTEPTARVLLALRVLRPSAADSIAEAERTLGDRECKGGGWNYGNRDALGTDLKPYAQTTAVALIGLQGQPADLADRGRQLLIGRWRDERGGLTLAQATVAFRLTGGLDDLAALTDAIGEQFDKTAFLGNRLSLAWAVLATAPDERLDALRAAA